MVNIYLLENFNNYYNREIKKPKSLNDYLEASNLYYVAQNQQFKLADGVNTTYIFNIPAGTPDCSFVDYLLAVNQSGEIETRWFVLEQHKTRENQYQLVLRRDLIADFLEPFKNATIYLEKGYITNPSNYLIYNQEQFTANQIKKREIPLKDTLGLKWIVGYVNKNSLGYVANEDGTITQTTKEYRSYLNKAYTPDITVSGLSNWEYYDFINGSKRYAANVTANFDYQYGGALDVKEYYSFTVEENSAYKREISVSDYRGNITSSYNTFPTGFYGNGLSWDGGSNSNMWQPQTLKDEANRRIGGTNKETYETVKALKGQVIFDGSKYYKISIKEEDAGTTELNIPDTNLVWYGGMYNLITTLGMRSNPSNSENFRLTFTWSPFMYIELTEVNNKGYKVSIDGEKHNRTVNEAYDMFAIPVLDKMVNFYMDDDAQIGLGNYYPSDYNSAFAIGQALTEVASEAIDLQLLPYCPLPETMVGISEGRPTFYLKTSEISITWSVISYLNDNPANTIFFLSSNEFSKLIPFTDENDYSTPEKVKEINQLVSYRLCAGDYSSAFEFNPAKNGGISYFEVDCKYKPFAPYIHVAPNFGNLYGRDYNDTRGLVCSNTNYSLSRGTDAWATYERSNLNYNNAFNRQIENMEVQREYQRRQEVAQAIVGTLQGASTGGLIGSSFGGGLAGAAIGGISSAALGALDIQYSDALYKENKQYAIDQFNMSLENIRALPNTLVATGAQNPNNKVFPVLEIYSCSNVEKEAFQQKLKWNGMTIGVITESIGDYLKPADKTYIKGQLIYINDTFNPYKASEIANELAKGLLIEGGII
jgi:hypothetical protein